MIDINCYPDRLEKLVRVSRLNPQNDEYPLKEQDIKNEQLLRKISNQVDLSKPEEVEKAKSALKLLEDILVISYEEQGMLPRPKEVLGFGLAAIQVKELAGQDWVPRVSVIRVTYNKDKPLILNLINPQIIKGMSSYLHKGEGCLSYPGHYLSTRRYYGVRLGFIDGATLEPREMELYGIEAVCVQHECDHHDGIIFKDKHNFPMVVKAKVGPNEPCSCGSGKKFKKCCQGK